MTKQELIEEFLEQLNADAEQDNIDSVFELCEMLIKDAKRKTLEDLKDSYIGE